MPRAISTLIVAAALICASATPSAAQRGGSMPDSVKAKRWAIENELQSLAIVDRKVMIRMRDGIRIPADVYRPRDTSRKYPTIWVRTPYNFNFWDV